MRSIREALLSPGRKTFAGESLISKRAKNLRSALRGEAKVVPAQRLNGSSGSDLLQRFTKGDVQRGDILEITTAYRPADEDGKGERLLYLGPDRFGFGTDIKHHFHPEKPYEGMPGRIIEGFITSWKKVGHVTPQEWSKRMEQTFGPKKHSNA